MVYKAGDYVYPTHLPRRVLCRVGQAETLSTSSGSVQVLRLEPLEGPWPRDTALIRLGENVIPVDPGELWRSALAMQSVQSATQDHRPAAQRHAA